MVVEVVPFVRHMSGDAELDAWASHGVAAATRARRVIGSVRAAHQRAQLELATGGKDLDELCGEQILKRDPFIGNDIKQQTTILTMRSKVLMLRNAARKRIAQREEKVRRLEEAQRAHVARIAQREADAAAAAAAAAKLDKEKRIRAEVLRKKAEEAERRAAEDRLRHEAEEKRQAELKRVEEEAKSKELAKIERAKKLAQRAAEDPWPADAMNSYVEFEELVAKSETFGNSTQPELKRVRTTMKRAINKAGNQVAGSQTQVARCIDLIVGALNTSATDEPAHAWACVFAARRLVRAGESVAVGPLCFAVASVMAGVCAFAPQPNIMKIAARGALLEGNTATAPHFVRQREGESAEQFRERSGARKDEGSEALMNRAANTVALYAALCQMKMAPGPTGVDARPNLFGLDDAWTWLARVVNGKQHPFVPITVVAFIDVAGYEMCRRYGKQFAKLMACVQQRVLKKAVKGTPPGPLANIENLVHEFVKNKFVVPNEPHGKSLPVRDAVNE